MFWQIDKVTEMSLMVSPTLWLSYKGKWLYYKEKDLAINMSHKQLPAQSAGAVEYDDCISAQG